MLAQLLAKWSKELESDIRSVVTEAGLSVSATSAVVDASKRGAIADNPGVLLCQVNMGKVLCVASAAVEASKRGAIANGPGDQQCDVPTSTLTANNALVGDP
eukprot:scaffold56020_cov18-Tisochrysis_lutea.AAC.2